MTNNSIIGILFYMNTNVYIGLYCTVLVNYWDEPNINSTLLYKYMYMYMYSTRK